MQLETEDLEPIDECDQRVPSRNSRIGVFGKFAILADSEASSYKPQATGSQPMKRTIPEANDSDPWILEYTMA